MRTFLAAVVTIAGCTCRRDAPVVVAPVDTAVDELAHDLTLQRNVLIAFGNATPLPLSDEMTEEVPALRPPLERAATQHPNAPLAMRVARDVPYAQLTRLMQAALAFRVVNWELQSEDASGTVHKVLVRGPGPTPRGTCWARAWVGPDARVLVGLDLGGDSATGMTGVLVNPRDERVQGDKVVDVLRRVDARCKSGEVRLYSQPTARAGPVLDLARAFSTASPPPHLVDVLLAVPSIGHLDSVNELAK